MTTLPILLAAVFLGIGNFFPKIVHESFFPPVTEMTRPGLTSSFTDDEIEFLFIYNLNQ